MSEAQTKRVIGPLGAISIVAGSMLGIGVFLSPPLVAKALPAALPYFGVWVLAGLSALAGAVACGELGAMMPQAGGDYVFQRRAFGPSAAFASGWVLFGAIFTGSVAALAVPVCQYQLPVLLGPLARLIAGPEAQVDLSAAALGPLTWTQLIAMGLVWGFTALNLLGARLAAWAQTLMTLTPVALLSLGALYALLGGAPLGAAAPPPPPESPMGWSSWVAAWGPVYFAYAGWNAVIYVAGEVERPSRNIPLGLIGGTLLITALYLLLNGAFVEVLGFGGIASSFEVGTATAAALGGDVAKVGITALIASALLASLNTTILGGARVAMAMAEGGALSGFFARTNPRGVPARALIFQAAWACVLIVSGTFEQLLSLVSLAMMICGSLTVASLFVLRVIRPREERPYRATGYPLLPAFYLLSSGAVVVLSLWEAVRAPEWSGWFPMFGLGLMVVVFLAHLAWSHIPRARAQG